MTVHKSSKLFNFTLSHKSLNIFLNLFLLIFPLFCNLFYLVSTIIICQFSKKVITCAKACLSLFFNWLLERSNALLNSLRSLSIANRFLTYKEALSGLLIREKLATFNAFIANRILSVFVFISLFEENFKKITFPVSHKQAVEDYILTGKNIDLPTYNYTIKNVFSKLSITLFLMFSLYLFTINFMICCQQINKYMSKYISRFIKTTINNSIYFMIYIIKNMLITNEKSSKNDEVFTQLFNKLTHNTMEFIVYKEIKNV